MTRAHAPRQAKERKLHGQQPGPKLDRWWQARVEVQTKRISQQLTDMMTEAQLYGQTFELQNAWEVDLPPRRTLCGSLALRVSPAENEVRRRA